MLSAIRNGGRALHWRGPGASIGRCINASTRGGRNTTTARGDDGGRREPRNAPSRSRRAARQVAPTWCREFAAVCPRRLQIHPARQARGSVQEEAPLNSVVRSTRRTVGSTCGVLVRVWGVVVVRVCGCTLRSHGMARAVRRVRLQDLNTAPPQGSEGEWHCSCVRTVSYTHLRAPRDS